MSKSDKKIYQAEALVNDLINDTIKLSINTIRKFSVKYGTHTYNFDEFIKEYQLNNDCTELFDNLTIRGFKFDDTFVKRYMARGYDSDDNNPNLSWHMNNKKDDSYLVNPIIHRDSPDYDLFETLLDKNLNPNFDDIDELCFRAEDVIKTYDILLKYGYKFDHHKNYRYVLYNFIRKLDESKNYFETSRLLAEKVKNHPEVKRFFGKEFKITKLDIKRAESLGAYITDKLKNFPPDFPKFTSKFIENED